MKPHVLLVLGLVGVCGWLQAEPITLTVSAAISLRSPLETLESAFEKSHPEVDVVYNFGSSGSLQHQIVHGAPVDVYLAAAAQPMDDLESKNLLVPGSRVTLAGNALVLIASTHANTLRDFSGLAAPDIKTIAVGEPTSVPAGRYAREVLAFFRLSDSVRKKLVFGKNVRQVLVYVETGNADAGIVYRSDTVGSQSVRVVATAPPESHSEIQYPGAILKDSPHPSEAQTFLIYLQSPAARDVFQSAGFTPVARP